LIKKGNDFICNSKHIAGGGHKNKHITLCWQWRRLVVINRDLKTRNQIIGHSSGAMLGEFMLLATALCSDNVTGSRSLEH